MSASAARALWLASALLALRGALPPGSPEPVVARAAPQGGALRLLYGLPLDLNREPAEALELLPGVGPARAAEIVAGRPYCDLAALDRVPGIGPATVERLAKLVAFHGPPPNCKGQLREEKH